MIDINKCKFEEKFRNDFYEETVYYFTYPKEGMNEIDFYPEEDYGNVVGTCLSLTMLDNGDYYMQMSPTIAEDEMLSDVEWRDLYEDFNYDYLTVKNLLNLVKEGN